MATNYTRTTVCVCVCVCVCVYPIHAALAVPTNLLTQQIFTYMYISVRCYTYDIQ